MPNKVGVNELAGGSPSLTNRGSEPLPTLKQAEDAGAVALAQLFCEALARAAVGPGEYPPGTFESPGFAYIVAACRELLRGPLADDGSRRPGGYCIRAPTDPTLRALGILGARLVEISYVVRNVPRALDEVDALIEEFRRVPRS